MNANTRRVIEMETAIRKAWPRRSDVRLRRSDLPTLIEAATQEAKELAEEIADKAERLRDLSVLAAEMEWAKTEKEWGGR